MSAEPIAVAIHGLNGSVYVSPGQLAAYWGVCVETIYRDIKKGALAAYKLPGGQIRILVEDARRYGRPLE